MCVLRKRVRKLLVQNGEKCRLEIIVKQIIPSDTLGNSLSESVGTFSRPTVHVKWKMRILCLQKIRSELSARMTH